ncbi:hypothetical protein [Nonlabens spongiae]|nr:hypothetical protein [Nonlabens spongiae]
MKLFHSTIFCFLMAFASGQEIKIIHKSDSIPNIKERGLSFIHEKTDLDSYHLVGTVQVVASNFNEVVNGLQSSANDFSANAFKLKNFTNKNESISVTMDLYAVSLKDLEQNNSHGETNVLYFLGNDSRTQKFKINREKIILESDKFFRYEIPKGEKIKINKGGFTGMTVYHQWVQDQPVIFYALGSGNVSTSQSNGTTLNIGFNTGKFIELKGDLAYLYLNLNQATEKL